MTTKATALLTSACAVCLFVLSLIIPNDPYFFFISSNIIVSLIRVVLASALIYLTLKRRFKYKPSRSTVSTLAAILVSFGAAGLFIPTMDYSLYNVFKPFDYLYFIGCGFYIGYYTMALQTGRRKLRLPTLTHSLHLPLPERIALKRL